nr:TPA_asm: hypothetical protein HUJ06_023361 [Nelumbo nucifera]
MLLGKRPRLPMRRTTSLTEFTVDLNNVEAPVPSDPQNPMKDRQKPVGEETHARRTQPGGGKAPGGFNDRLLATVSPRNPRRNSADLVQTAHFLRACGLCKRRLAPGRDIYMYR